MHVRGLRGEGVELPTGTVTFLFTDIEGSTRLLQRVGPRYRYVLEEHAALIRRAVDARGGVEVNTEGDAFFVVFDRAQPAVAAALEAQRYLFEHSWPEGTTLRVRMGLHTGEGLLGAEDYVGLDVHRAARIASVAHGGQVLVSAATSSLVEAGLDEGTRLRDLGEHRLKDLQRPERLFQLVAPGLPVEFPPLRTAGSRPHNLPVQATAFVGRERQVREVQDLLAGARIVTLTGPGGTGKTRLAIQVGQEVLDRFPDGVFLVRLETLEDPALVTTTIARALGITEGGARPVSEVLREHLADRTLLLVLDNLEHLPGATPQVATLLEEAPGLRVLATSQTSLRVRGEQEYPVLPLETPQPEDETDPDRLLEYEAVALFVRRAREADPRFALIPQNAAAVAGIVRALDGLPLALELAAARVKLLRPSELLDRLSDRLALLTAGPLDAPDRHRTLRDAIAWSYELLDPQDRALFSRLAVFAGSFTLEAAEALAGDPPVQDVLAGISNLVDRSLLRRRVDIEEDIRFQMLESIRAYAQERLADGGEEDQLARAHSAYFLERIERAAPELTRSRKGAWLGRLELDHDDLRAALGRALETRDADTGLRLAAALWRFWQLRGHLEEGRDWLERLLELPGSSARTRLGGLLGLAGVVYWQGDMERAGRLYDEALRISRELGNTDGTVEALTSLGMLALFRQDQEEADRYLNEAIGLVDGLDDAYNRLLPSLALGMSRLLAGDPAGAQEVFVEMEAVARRSGGGWWLGQVLVLRVRAELAQERHAQAEETVREALEMFLAAGDVSSLAQAFDWLGTAAARQGQLERGVRLAGAAQAVRDRMGVGLTLGARGLASARELAVGGLSDEQIEDAWAGGLIMDLEEALAYARRGATPAAADPDHAGPTFA